MRLLDEFGYRARRGEAWPAIDVEVILEALGWEIVQRLFESFRGEKIRIPSDASEFAPALGREFSTQLSERFAGRSCVVPASEEDLLRCRDKHVRRDRQAGMAADDLIQRYRLGGEAELQRVLGIE